ncbi:hypothetical protein TELCIR_08795 [Teladorsagia circumcincta]|uniref:Carboxylesterase type B domain-containing protein n=1 Tax=Teladorsagia circumcincta TaxID=45464 RepID=A0A2G9UGJ9_TELCI|nr:hypothetical protein TELCIR_08795 [Teladorsagia circumcincta]
MTRTKSGSAASQRIQCVKRLANVNQLFVNSTHVTYYVLSEYYYLRACAHKRSGTSEYSIMWPVLAVFLLMRPSCIAFKRVNVSISSGTLTGYQTLASSGKAVNVFKRVPYAAPPVGELRFQKPQPVKKWDGVQNATGG